MLLAELAPPGTENLLSIMAFLVAIAGGLVFLVKQLRRKEPSQMEISGQPLRFAQAVEYASRREHDDLKKKVEELATENRQLISDQSRETKQDFAGVHTRITDLLSAFHELKGMITRELKSRSN